MQAIRFGQMLFISGQGPLDPASKTVIAGDIEVQTRQTLKNLASVLEAAGANVVNMRVILRDVSNFPRFNEVFRDVLNGEKVTHTCVGGTRIGTSSAASATSPVHDGPRGVSAFEWTPAMARAAEVHGSADA